MDVALRVQDPPREPVAAGRPPARETTGDESSERSERNARTESRRERRKRETFERLLAAARNALWSKGLNEVTVEQITDAADVGKGTFFNYFPSKEHAIPEVNDFPRRVLKAAEEARTGSEPVLQVLERIVRTMLWPPSLDASWITFWDNYLEVMITSGDIRALISGQMSTVRHAYTILLTLGQERREIRRDRPAGELAAQLHSVLLGHTLIEWIHRGTLQSPETEAILTHALSTLKPPAPPRRPHAARRPVRATRSRPRAAKGRTRR